jgi:hypothetical protein
VYEYAVHTYAASAAGEVSGDGVSTQNEDRGHCRLSRRVVKYWALGNVRMLANDTSKAQ